MLSSTADHLFWMARYVERAENTARMLDANLQTSLLPQAGAEQGDVWHTMLCLSELKEAYYARHEHVTPDDVLEFMVSDTTNLASIYCCFRAARENARAVKGALTTELWETFNTTWLEMNQHLQDGMHQKTPGEFFEWVKFRSHLTRGVLIGTMLNDEAFHFARLGTFLERADNTARILDVNFKHPVAQAFHPTAAADRAAQSQSQGQSQSQSQPQTAAPVDEPDDSMQRDYYHWASLLRSVSAFENYRKVYRHAITPARVAELLILRGDMPRSLRACLAEVELNLAHLANKHSQETERRAGMLHAELRFGRIDDILHTGVHGYLTDFLERINDLGARISQDFLVGQR